MSLRPLNVHWKGEGPQTYYPMRGCAGFSRVTVEADEYRKNQLPWEYRKKYTLTEQGEHILKADNDSTFLYEPVVTVDVGKHLYTDTVVIMYPLVNPGNDNIASIPTQIQTVWERTVDINEIIEKRDKDALGYRKIRIVVQPDQRVPVHYQQAYVERKRRKTQLLSTELVMARTFTGWYTDAVGGDGVFKGCDAYYNGFEITTDVEIPITTINKVSTKEYRKELIPTLTVTRGEVAILVCWEWKEILNLDPEWIIRAVFVGDDEGFFETLNVAGWAVTKRPRGHKLDREIRLGGMGEKTLACAVSSVDKGTSQVFELRIDHDVFTMELGSILDPIIPGSIDEMLGRGKPGEGGDVRAVMSDDGGTGNK